jgi:hypothetical protein
MADKLCGSCRYWGKLDDEDNGRFRQCRAVIHDKNSAIALEEWDDPLEERDWLPEAKRQELIALRNMSKAVVKDGSGYFAALKCREDFGCILWEGKSS